MSVSKMLKAVAGLAFMTITESVPFLSVWYIWAKSVSKVKIVMLPFAAYSAIA